MEIVTSWMETGMLHAAQRLVLRQLNRRVGKLEPHVAKRILELPLVRLETLCEDILAFSEMSDLVNWLERDCQSAEPEAIAGKIMNNRKYINLKRRETKFHLWRITEEEYRELHENSLPIKEDGFFLIQLSLSERHDPDRLTLPKAFLTLEYLFGKTSDFFDDWKGSFTFPLLLLVQKSTAQFFYMLRIYDHRGTIYYPVYRILENGAEGYDLNVYHEPFENEFSRQEINEFISHLHGYLVGVSTWVCQPPSQPFFKRIDSNHILYGYRNGEFFEEQIDSEEEYKAAIQTLEEICGSKDVEKQSRNLKLLLQQITGRLS